VEAALELEEDGVSNRKKKINALLDSMNS